MAHWMKNSLFLGRIGGKGGERITWETNKPGVLKKNKKNVKHQEVQKGDG